MRILALILCCTIPSLAQQIAVSRQNRTITISADQTVKFEPEIARLEIGRQDYAASKDEAFRSTKEAVARIIDSLRHNGVRDEAISTENITLEEQTQSDSSRTVPEKERFHSTQRLQVIVSVGTAQRVLDSAVQAGANDIGSPVWLLKDYDLAQARAAGAALKKARINAEQMASGLGAKLGDLVYASNTVPPALFVFRAGLALSTEQATLSSGGAPLVQQLKLFPRPVEVKATVYATFAIE